MDSFQIVVLAVGSLLLVVFIVLLLLFLFALSFHTTRPEERAMHTATTIFTCCIAFVIIMGNVLTLVQYVFATVSPDDNNHANDGGDEAHTTITTMDTAIRICDRLMNTAVLSIGLFHAMDILLHIRRATEGKLNKLLVPMQMILLSFGLLIVAVFVALPAVIGGAMDLSSTIENSSNSTVVNDLKTNGTLADQIAGTPSQLGAHVSDVVALFLSIVFVVVGILLSVATMQMRLPGKKSLVIMLSLLGMTLAYGVMRLMLVVIEALFSQWLVDQLSLDGSAWRIGRTTAFLVHKVLVQALLSGYLIAITPLFNTKLVETQKHVS